MSSPCLTPQQEHAAAHNLAARLDNLAGAIAELQADLAAGHKHRPRLADLAGYWATIAAELALAAKDTEARRRRDLGE
jgi:hypothetical protein